MDLPAELDEDTARGLVAVLAARSDEDQTALRGRTAHIRRLVRAPLAGRPAPRAWRTSGAALVTGGTGGLGAHTARLLARKGAEHLVLTSRRGPEAPGAEALREELTALGCRVTIAACDVADREALERLVAEVEADGPAIRTVVHTAGVGMLAPSPRPTWTSSPRARAPNCSAPRTSTPSSTTTGWTPSSSTRPSPKAPGAAATTARTRPPTPTWTRSPTSAGPAA